MSTEMKDVIKLYSIHEGWTFVYWVDSDLCIKIFSGTYLLIRFFNCNVIQPIFDLYCSSYVFKVWDRVRMQPLLSFIVFAFKYSSYFCIYWYVMSYISLIDVVCASGFGNFLMHFPFNLQTAFELFSQGWCIIRL